MEANTAGQITFSDAGVERQELSGGGGRTGPGPAGARQSSAADVFTNG